MRIVHLCVSNFYIDGRTYQENELVRQHVADGHDLLVIASTETYSKDNKLTYIDPSEYTGEDGARVIRLAYHPLVPTGLAPKLRIHRGIPELLEMFQPDLILFHGLCGWELLTAARFVKSHPDVLLYADSHADWNNSARSSASRLLHRFYYRPIVRRALSAIRKILCVSIESMDFVSRMYGICRRDLEFYPLGGHPHSDQEYNARRVRTREQYGIDDDTIMFVQSGKMTVRKKLLETIEAFAEIPDPRFRLLVAGGLGEDIRSKAEHLIANDSRVQFVGWKSSAELTDLLCAADVYVQPGTQSVTMQHSLCARCVIILDDVPSHGVYHQENGWLIHRSHTLRDVLGEISSDGPDLGKMSKASYRLAVEMLDYADLAKRVLS